jgi:hypothetical protein
MMRPLLAISTAVDRLNEKIGYICNLLGSPASSAPATP